MNKKNLDKLIKEATIDCYDSYECLNGFCCALEDKLEFPFEAKVIGKNVKVIGLEGNADTIDAVCKRNGKEYNVNLLNIEYNPKKVEGSKWIEAYKKWATHQ